MKPKFGVKDNPLTWLDWVLNGASHDNFFEKRVTEYSVNGMDGEWGWEEEEESPVCGLDGKGCLA
jgi:ribonucleotide reductase beta subunit family protein with ferritin-like domain